ncbi:MAG: hypothetical protein JW849_06510 [Phycisphaerae bacterium]|nr:hypothetical protein [Phycisphaerae bacterium]
MALCPFIVILSEGPNKVRAEAEGPRTKPAAEAPVEYSRSEQLATLANRRISESSGLANSRLTPGAFWTHNDSGDSPRAFAFNRGGEHLATLRIRDARAVDWEDMCSYELAGKSYLLLADVGDNNARRKTCTLYIVEEPTLDAAKRNADLSADAAVRVEFTYEDGPRDCESVAVDPTTKQILLVSKRGRVRYVYTLPIPETTPSRPLVAKKIATLTIPDTTAMDVSPDGRRAVVLTYLSAYEYTRRDGESWSQAFARPPRMLLIPLRRQGESICYGRDGKTLYLTSEQLPTPLIEIKPK